MAQIYISYSQNNQDVAKKIRNALEALGHTIWLDDPDIEFDRSLAEQLERGLREAEIVVALLSPSSVKSRTVRREIALAKSLEKTIIPVLVEPLPNVGEGGKFIDATSNVQTAISRLVKVIEARAGKTPVVSQQTLVETDEDEEEDEGWSLTPMAIVMIVILLVVVAIAVLSLTRPTEPTTETAALTVTQVQSTVIAQGTEAAVVRATNDAQATTIAELALTQTAVAEMPTDVPQLPTETPTDDAEATSPPTGVAVTEEAEGAMPTVTRTIAAPQPTADFTQSGPTDEPSPTAEDSDQGIVVPTSPPTSTIDISQARANNLLQNAGFESFTTDSAGAVAQGWTTWSITGGDRPSYQLPPTYDAAGSNVLRIFDGINAQSLSATYATFDGGLYQRVTGFQSGDAVRFSVQAYVWSSNASDVDESEEDGDVTVQVGIDPTGGTDATSSNVIWSEPVELYDAYNEYSVTTGASGNAVTVFIRATVDFPVANNYVYVDDALLFVIGD
jgi:hypothetical protein